jgi:GNAT superfamily N-acetyltransferase
MSPSRAITIADAPAIPGLAFRHFHGANYFPLMVRIAEASETFDGEEFIHTAETIAHDYARDYSVDPYRDVIIAVAHGQLIGYYKCGWESELGDKTRIYYSWGCLLPEWRRKGIGRPGSHLHSRHGERKIRLQARLQAWPPPGAAAAWPGR